MINYSHKKELEKIELSASFLWDIVVYSLGKYPTETSDLGYTYLSKDSYDNDYPIIKIAEFEDKDAEYLLKLHEIGHSYRHHLIEDKVNNSKYLNEKLKEVYRNHGYELVNEINSKCGIQNADILLEKLMDDPRTNHLVWNIAKDMEINSVILNLDDIIFLENYVSSLIPDTKKDDLLNKLDDISLEKPVKEPKIKLVHPSRFRDSEGNSFPDKLLYTDYFLLIIKNLDQFVKVMVSLKSGGNADPSNVSQQDIQDSLKDSWENNHSEDYKQGYKNAMDKFEQKLKNGEDDLPNDDVNDKSDDYIKGYGDAINDIKDLINKGFSKDKISSLPPSSSINDIIDDVSDDNDLDQSSNDRDKADEELQDDEDITRKRELGASSAFKLEQIDYTVDPLEDFLKKVIKLYRKKVIEEDELGTVRNHTFKVNRGIGISYDGIVVPVEKPKYVTKINKNKIVFLIDSSYSMDNDLIDKILKTISNSLQRIDKSIRYDIISWNIALSKHYKDLDPSKKIEKFPKGGGTELASGMIYMVENYSIDDLFIIISDFEDDLSRWREVESLLDRYTIFGIKYGTKVPSNKGLWKNIREIDIN